MTKKPPSGLAASGHADDADPEQITKEHNEDGQEGEGQSINIDPSEDVTVEAAEDVTTEATDRTPHPSLRPGAADGTPAPRAPTLMGVPIQSLPLPGVTAASMNEDETRTIDYDEEITVLAQAAPASTAAAANLYDRDDSDDSLGPSIVDDDEEETKVEPAESAMKAAESIDDVTTALSAQASLEREKALRRSVAAPMSSAEDDLEFADPEADDQDEEEQEEEEESLDDELSDEDEVISAGGAGAVEDDDDIDDGDDDAHDGAPTATFMKPADSTGLSGLLNPRRPPTGAPFGREGFGSRLPTPYAVAASSSAASTAPAPSTSPFASRLGPAPSGSPYGARATGTAIPAIQVPPPSGAATTASDPGFFSRRVEVPGGYLVVLVLGCFVAGFGLRGAVGGKSVPTAPTTIVAKPTATPAAPATPVVEPVAGSTPAAPIDPKAAVPIEPAKPAGVAPGLAQAGTDPASDPGLWKPAKKPAAPRPHKPAIDTASEEAVLKPAAASKPAAAPKPAIVTTPKPATPAAPKAAATPKPAKKPTKAWVDPFAQ
jgi:hypothetical protein